MRDRWEGLETRVQAAIAFPPLWVFFFVLNLGPFRQPLGSCLIYGIIEGGLFTGLLLLATSSEKTRRGGGSPPTGGPPTGGPPTGGPPPG